MKAALPSFTSAVARRLVSTLGLNEKPPHLDAMTAVGRFV